ncbi:MAG: MFS transporter, partial [Planctomycetota bacterium]
LTAEKVLKRNLSVLPVFSVFTYPFACVPILYFLMRDRGMDKSQFAVLQAIYYIGMALFELPTGWLADRLGRKIPMVLGPILLSAGFSVIYLATGFRDFAAGQLLFAFGHATLSGPPSALLFESLLHTEWHGDYLRQESRMSTWRSLGTGLSFLGGGLCGHFLGLAAVVLLTSILCLVAAGAALFLAEPTDSGPARSMPGPRLHERLGSVFRKPGVRWLLLYYVLLFFLLRYGFHTLQPWLESAQSEGPLFVGLLTFLFTFIALPFTRFAHRIRDALGEGRVLALMPLLVSLAFVGLSLGTSTELLFFFLFLQIPFGLHWPIIHSYANHRIPSQDRALVLSILSFSGRIGFAAVFPLVFHRGSMVVDDYLHVGAVTLVLALFVGKLRPRS